MSYPPAPRCSEFQRKSGVGPYVIAEIGVNHEGDLKLAERLIHRGGKGRRGLRQVPDLQGG
jgi:hypothetical protein